ncbi:sterol desaturase family protein [Pseudorhodoferax soli]|uniref:Sterol desaturase/sphingolipid hydroxylase (Fatty acid hydroxylase superfamily) n=1 Tax=Pseudorhodoferax soli TaxID=545864 RepID=A0A368XQ75_9BURK|nr:sterol desaturase family protein [Pseudorhodoferax soli]RCW69178.1 sterol desaturase/sphingolipid hydroxylase (fatty acid hydroxylase superfamily) [Pseudorhodoferax soli]
MNTIEKILLFGAAPVVLLLSLLEAVVLSRRGGYDWHAYGVSLFDFVGRIAITVFVPLTIAAPLVRWVEQHRLATIPVESVGAGLLLFLLLEFFYYWLHRAGHRVRWFWCNHAVHHTPNQLNLGASLRIGMFGKLSGNVVFLLPLVWIGFDLRLVLAALSLNLLYQFWLHATWIPRLGWLEHVLNTPSAHRVHHAANLDYLDANYGGVLIVFDRLFGTYTAERDALPCRYGLVHPMASRNPLTVELAQWLALARDLVRVRSLRALLGHLCMPPGWSPTGAHETTEALRARAAGPVAAALSAPRTPRLRTDP